MTRRPDADSMPGIHERGHEAGSARLRLLGQFELVVDGRQVGPANSCKRLLTLAALTGAPMTRATAAGMLWPDVGIERANANLRSALWRLQRCCPPVLAASFHELRLVDEVRVDLDTVKAVTRRLLDRSSPMDAGVLREALGCNLHDDIAPDLGNEGWLAAERERHHQLRLHALEALAERLIEVGWHGAAVDAALGAVRADPFRESASSLLVRAFLAEGNVREARRHFTRYHDLVRRELGVAPSAAFTGLFKAWAAGARTSARTS